MQEITKIQLKKPKEPINDRSNPNPKKQLEDFKESKAKATYANVENWFEGLKDHVIPAFIFPLDNEEAEAIIANYESKMVKSKGRILSEKETKLLEQLAIKIDECAKKNIPDGNEKGFFVRISTRSAKDGMMFHKKTFDAVAKRIDELKHKNKVENVSDNDKLGIIFSEFINQLTIRNGKEAVELLSQSHRIWQDLIAYREVRSDKNEMSIILRPWIYIPTWGEFRGFVYDRKLVAISSYNRAVHFPFVVEHKDAIEKRIKEHFAVIEPKIIPQLKNFICDFAFLGEDLKNIIIVELNQYRDYEGNATNAELFDWVKDDDILTGKAPFQFRVLTKPLEHEVLMKTITAPLKVHLGYLSLDKYDFEKDHL